MHLERKFYRDASEKRYSLRYPADRKEFSFPGKVWLVAAIEKVHKNVESDFMSCHLMHVLNKGSESKDFREIFSK